MNYLAMTQRAVLESRVRMAPPAGISGLTGLASDIARWVNEAWLEFQRAHVGRLKCLRVRDFTATALTVGDNEYSITAAAPDLAIANFASFEKGTLYTQKPDGSQKAELQLIAYDKWVDRYKLATFVPGQPSLATMPTVDTIIFNTLPDVAYRLKGNIWRTPQELAADADTPLLAARFHMFIVWEAVKKLAADRENGTLWADAEKASTAIYNDMLGVEIECYDAYQAYPLA